MELVLSDFKEEIENYFMPCGLNPGRRNIFQAAYGAQNTEHEIRRSSTREYYQWTGSPKRNENLKKARKRNGIEEIESNFPSAKTAVNMCGIFSYTWKRYSHSIASTMTQRKIQSISRQTKGTRRTNNVPLKGHRPGLVGVLYRMLKRREARGELVVVIIDEYLTSQICHNCQARSLKKCHYCRRLADTDACGNGRPGPFVRPKQQITATNAGPGWV
ncbi:hypothetical protein VTP01DRAFT_6641 [Rhizomucor pusillus]|uniref:uncharacterized protein n=1 Tax=Rhizomucor pusillus TaxID=4840 RepID=UPI0037442F17